MAEDIFKAAYTDRVLGEVEKNLLRLGTAAAAKDVKRVGGSMKKLTRNQRRGLAAAGGVTAVGAGGLGYGAGKLGS